MVGAVYQMGTVYQMGLSDHRIITCNNTIDARSNQFHVVRFKRDPRVNAIRIIATAKTVTAKPSSTSLQKPGISQISVGALQRRAGSVATQKTNRLSFYVVSGYQ